MEGGDEKCEGGMLEGGSSVEKNQKGLPKKLPPSVIQKKKTLLVVPVKLIKKRKKLEQSQMSKVNAGEPVRDHQDEVVQIEDSSESLGGMEGELGEGKEMTHEITFEAQSM